MLRIKCNFSHLIITEENSEVEEAEVEVSMEANTFHGAKSAANLDTVLKTVGNTSTRTSMDGKICQTTLNQLRKLTIST